MDKKAENSSDPGSLSGSAEAFLSWNCTISGSVSTLWGGEEVGDPPRQAQDWSLHSGDNPGADLCP